MKLNDRNLYWITNYLDYLVVGIESSCARMFNALNWFTGVWIASRNLKCFVNWTNREFRPNNIFLICFCGIARERPSFVTGTAFQEVLFSLLKLSEHFKHEKLFQSFNNMLFFCVPRQMDKNVKISICNRSILWKECLEIFSILKNVIVPLILSEISIRQRTISITHYFSLTCSLSSSHLTDAHGIGRALNRIATK